MSDLTGVRGVRSRRPYLPVTLAFGALAVALVAIMWTYWSSVLDARLSDEARSQAEILARSQSTLLATALRAPREADRARAVSATLDELLLLRDPETEVSFFDAIGLEVDYDAVPSPPGSLDLRRGEAPVAGGFRSEVAVYDPESAELLAIATFHVSDRLYQRLSSDVRRGLVGLTLAVLAVLVLAWAALLLLLRLLRRQEARRLRAELELHQQEQRHQRLVDSLSSYFLYSKDSSGQLQQVSDSVRRVLGYSPQEVVERFRERLGGLPAAARGKQPSDEVSYEVELADRDGRPRHVELSEVAVLGPEGVTTIDGIARDVTSQRQVHEELRHAKEQAEAANRAKSLFLANVSHEIRTPLNAILGMANLASKTELSAKQQGYVDRIQVAGRLLLEIIEDILDLSKIEAGRLEVHTADLDLDQILEELAGVVGVKAGEKGLEILLAPAADVPRRLRGDPVRLKQVLLNLLNNAIKFTERGEIVVSIEKLDERHDRARLRFSVRDTGIGIEPTDLPTLFDPFTQVDPTSTRRFGGVGLGLAISQRLVQMMGGQIAVESEPGRGSTFSFAVTFGVDAQAPRRRRLADALRGLRVLVADDNPSAREVIGEMLRSLSFDVTAVASGEEALNEAQRARESGSPFRLALLDWQMPGLDGAEAAARLALSATGDDRLPVVLITAHDRAEASRRAARAGVEIVLDKPVSPSSLHDAVLEALDPTSAPLPRTAMKTATPTFTAGQRVLLVEDNAINREVAREMLWGVGLEVTEAHNGREALELLDSQSFDAVLMDVQMPEMDGLEAVQRIRERTDLVDLPVFAMTAHAMIGDRERFLEAGMTDYVAKPVEEHLLLEVLGRHLRVDALAAVAVPEPHTPAVPGFDVDDGLRRMSGNRSLYRRLALRFLDENEGLIADLRRLVEEDRRGEALARLHEVKGTAGAVAARRVAEAAAEAERAISSGEDPGERLHELEGALAEAISGGRRLGEIDGASPAEAAGELDADVAAAAFEIVERLRLQLAANDLAATTGYAELRELVGEALPDRVRALGVCLDGLDFDSAREDLDAIESALWSARGAR